MGHLSPPSLASDLCVLSWCLIVWPPVGLCCFVCSGCLSKPCCIRLRGGKPHCGAVASRPPHCTIEVALPSSRYGARFYVECWLTPCAAFCVVNPDRLSTGRLLCVRCYHVRAREVKDIQAHRGMLRGLFQECICVLRCTVGLIRMWTIRSPPFPPRRYVGGPR